MAKTIHSTSRMQLFTLFAFSLTYLHVVFPVEYCKERNNPCFCSFQDGFIDLSTIALPGMTRFSMMLFEGHLYSYNPCYSFSYRAQDFEVSEYPCTGVAACVIIPGDENGSIPTQRALGLQSRANFFHDGIVTRVNYTLPENTKTLTVTLVCNLEVEHQLHINSESDFTLTTWCACLNNDKCKSASPEHHKSGLSTGSILLITFFVILLVYLGVGILFNFCRGAHGTELLPNVEFWNELPKLIVDGFLYTCSCFGRRSAYADV